MPKAPKSKRKAGDPPLAGVLSKYFPVDSIPSKDIRRGPPPPDPTREEDVERSFLSHNGEGGFQAFANLYTMVYLAKPKLVQEAVQDDPWKLLIATMFLNKTSGKVALPVFWYVIKCWPTPEKLAEADFETLKALLHHLGLSNTRAHRLRNLSRMYIEHPPNPRLVYKSKVTKRKETVDYPPTHVSHYPGSGKYALDSYRIFCMGKGEWKKVLSDDKELRRYLRWRWAVEEFKEWNEDVGVVGPITLEYLERLPRILAG